MFIIATELYNIKNTRKFGVVTELLPTKKEVVDLSYIEA